MSADSEFLGLGTVHASPEAIRTVEQLRGLPAN